MNDPGFPYSEDILQWVWNALLFEVTNLKTAKGEEVTILNKGTYNVTDGPDFLNASIRIGNITWNGAVELHLHSEGWYEHGHHTDPKYNNVILHVVAEHKPGTVERAGGGSPATLNLLPYLDEELSLFIPHFFNSPKLPCVSGLRYISPEAFEQQLAKAHREYLEKKVNDFLHFYNPEQVPSTAWKQALILSFFDGLGITHNREAMVKTGEWVLGKDSLSEEELIVGALGFAGFRNKPSAIRWNHKGVRPHNHPRKRIVQGVRFAYRVANMDFQDFLAGRAVSFWDGWMGDIGLLGTTRAKILYGTVYLPALYVLGSLFGASSISQNAFERWQELSSPVPDILLRKFKGMKGIKPELYQSKLGAVHQLKEYCAPRRCHDCMVLKKVISS